MCLRVWYVWKLINKFVRVGCNNICVGVSCMWLCGNMCEMSQAWDSLCNRNSRRQAKWTHWHNRIKQFRQWKRSWNCVGITWIPEWDSLATLSMCLYFFLFRLAMNERILHHTNMQHVRHYNSSIIISICVSWVYLWDHFIRHQIT